MVVTGLLEHAHPPACLDDIPTLPRDPVAVYTCPFQPKKLTFTSTPPEFQLHDASHHCHHQPATILNPTCCNRPTTCTHTTQLPHITRSASTLRGYAPNSKNSQPSLKLVQPPPASAHLLCGHAVGTQVRRKDAGGQALAKRHQAVLGTQGQVLVQVWEVWAGVDCGVSVRQECGQSV